MYPYAHLLIRANGAFGSTTGSEKWSCSLRFGIVGAAVPYSESNLLTFVNAVHTALSTFHVANNVFAGSSCFLTHTTGARVGLDGLYEPDTQETIISTGPAQAGGTTTVMPWTTALVISLRTARPRGYASNGRVYWPFTAGGVAATTGRVTSASTTGRVTAFRTAINAMNTAAEAYAQNMRLAVFSNVGAGQVALVNEIRVDDRIDNVERRENASPPTWQTAPIP